MCIVIEKKEHRLNEISSQACFFLELKELWKPGEIAWFIYIFSISKIGKQVMWELSLDFGNWKETTYPI